MGSVHSSVRSNAIMGESMASLFQSQQGVNLIPKKTAHFGDDDPFALQPTEQPILVEEQPIDTMEPLLKNRGEHIFSFADQNDG